MTIENDRHRFDNRNSDNRIGVWNNPPRVLSDNRPSSRPYPPVDFDRELHHHHHHQHSLNHKVTAPYPPVDKLRYNNTEGSSRYEVKAREEFVWGRGDDKYHRRGSNLESSSGNSGMSSQSTLPRDIDPKTGGYVHSYGVEKRDNEISRGSSRREVLVDSKRWVVNDRKTPRDSHNSSFELGNNENVVVGDSIRVTSGKYYGSESGRFNNRGSREPAHEFARAPKKQIQKRSALLRIQMVKPNHRNREIEQSHYTSYANDNSNSFRGKEQLDYSGYGMKAEEREGSPVELDISFKSNSLVAKAIVAPSSSAIVSDADMTSVSDTDLTPPENRKNALVSDGGCSDLKLIKPSTTAVNSSSSPCKPNDTPSSGEAFNLQKSVSDSATHNSLGKNEGVQIPKGVVSGKLTKISSGKAPQRVTKKKKIVKKVVKRVVPNTSVNVSGAVSLGMPDRTVQAGSVTLNSSTFGSDKNDTTLKKKITAVDKVSLPDCLQSSPRDVNLLPDNRKEDIPPLSMGRQTMSKECKTDDNSVVGLVPRIERSENISSSPLVASSIKYEKNDLSCQDADNSAHGLPSMPTADEVTMSLNGSTFSDVNKMDEENKHPFMKENSLSSGQYSNVQCLENSYHVEDDQNCRLSSSSGSIINTDVINTCNSSNVTVAALSFTGVQQSTAVSEVGNVSKADCKSKTLLALTENTILEGNLETSLPVSSCGMVGLVSSGETSTQDGPECLEHSSVPISVSYNVPTSSEDNISIRPSIIVKDFEKQASPVDVTISPGNCTSEQFPNAKLSDKFCGGETSKSKKRKIGTQTKFSGSTVGGISPVPIHTVSTANVDTNLSMLKDPTPSGVLDPVVQRSDFSLQSIVGEFTVLHGQGEISEVETLSRHNDNNSVNTASPMSRTNEVTTSHLNFTLCQAELRDAIVVATSCAEVPSSLGDYQAHKEDTFSNMGKLSTSPSVPYSEDSAKLSDNSLVGGSVESIDANRETKKSDCSNLQHPGVDFHLLHEGMALQNDQFPVLEGEQKDNTTLVVPINNTQKDTLVIGNTEREKIDIQAIEKCEFRDVLRSPSADLKFSDLQMKDDLPLEYDCSSCPADVDGVTISNSNSLSDMFSPGTTSDMPDGRTLDCQTILNESIPEDEENADSSLIAEHGSDLPDSILSSQHNVENMKSDHTTGHNNLIMGKLVPEPLQVDSKVMTQGLNSSCSDINGVKSQPGCVIPTTIQGRSYLVVPKSKTSALSSHVSKLRTWHRTGNNSTSVPGSKPLVGIVPPKRPISEKKGNFQSNSYIRKGNSLVRKHTSVSALPQGSVNRSSLGFDEFHFRKSTGLESKVDITDQVNLLKTGMTNASLEKQRTPPPPVDSKLPNQTIVSPEENRSSPLIGPLSNADCDCASEPKIMEPYDALNSAEDALKSYETIDNQTGPSNNGESQIEANDGNVSSWNSKRIVYVKRKSNQLVATSSSCDFSVAADDHAQTTSSDGYYKRSENQLVRTTFESTINQTVGMPIVAANSDGQGTHKAACNRRFSKRRSHKGMYEELIML